jgi:2'-phosphotransferase
MKTRHNFIPKMDPKRLKLCTSHRLSKILRHQAKELGIPISSNGYVKLSDILSLDYFTEHSVTEEMIKDIVYTCPKKRFSLLEKDSMKENVFIRANQGHTLDCIEEEELLEELTKEKVLMLTMETGFVYHGTKRCFLPAILKNGLSRMKRNHIHFSLFKQNVRKSTEIIISVDVLSAMDAGYRFFRSDNNVILCSGERGRDLFFSKEFFGDIFPVER